MNENPSIHIRRISTGEVLKDAYFQDCGDVGGNFVSKVVVDGVEYVSKVSKDAIYYAYNGSEVRYRCDVDCFAKHDLMVEIV